MHDRLLIVDDEQVVLEFLQELLEDEGYVVATASDGPSALKWLEKNPSALMLCDIRMPGMDGFELLREVRKSYSAVDVVIMTAFGSMDSAIEAMSLGAADYLIKPLKTKEIVAKVRSHLKRRSLENQVQRLQTELRTWFGLDKIVANSEAMRGILGTLRTIAPGDQTLVLVGEPGTGRDFVARSTHFASPREIQLYRRVRCDSTSPVHFLRTLFGHQEAAGQVRAGLFEELANGTIHLNGIECLPTDSQQRIALALQRRVFTAVGSVDPIPLRVRLFFSFTRPVEQLLESGDLVPEFRTTLGVCPSVALPPLRDRTEDVVELVEGFAARHHAERGHALSVPPESMELLIAEEFPGNVAHLFSVLSHCATLSNDGVLTLEVIGNGIEQVGPDATTLPKPMSESLKDREYQLVLKAVNRHRGQLEEAAKELGVSRTTLWRRMRKYGIGAQGIESSASETLR